MLCVLDVYIDIIEVVKTNGHMFMRSEARALRLPLRCAVHAPATYCVNVYSCSSQVQGAFVFLTMLRPKAHTPAANGDAGETVPKKRLRIKQAPRVSPALAAPGLLIDQQLQQQQQQQDTPASNSGARQTIPNTKARVKQAARGLSTLATTGVPTDQQVQQQQQQYHSQQEQQQPQPQQARQLQPKQPAGTTPPKAEEDAPSEASTLVLAASSSSSCLTLPDVVHAAADLVVFGSMADSAAAPPQPKRQRSRKDSAAAPHGRTRSAVALSADPGRASTNTGASATAMVQHAVVSPKLGRAKHTVARCQRVFPKEIFLERAVDAREAFLQDLANRRFQYPLPFIGDFVCDFIGKTNTNNCHEIVDTDDVAFRWSYTCTPKQGIQIDGFCDSLSSARSIAVGALPPRTTRVMLNAIVVAKLYEKLFPELCPFILKYCDRKELDTGGCEILRFGFSKQLTKMPSIDEFVDATGTSAKWIRCTSIGDTDKSVCHPGASARYSTNRLTYSVSQFRVFSTKDRKEAAPESFKLRKRTVIRKDKYVPANLDDMNSGSHRGIRDMIAYGTALAEFELAKHQDRDVSVANAMMGFDLDPFAWEGSASSNIVAVIWRSGDGKHHLQTCSLRYLLGLITEIRGKQYRFNRNAVVQS